MLEENGVVVAIEDNLVWVQTAIKSTCGQCQAKDHCATGAIARTFATKVNVIAAEQDPEQPLTVAVGDDVVIAIDEQFVLRSAVYVYMLPIIGFMLFAGFGQLIVHDSGLIAEPGLSADLLTTLVAFFGGWCGYLMARSLLKEPVQTPLPQDSTIDPQGRCLSHQQVRLIKVNSNTIPLHFK